MPNRITDIVCTAYKGKQYRVANRLFIGWQSTAETINLEEVRMLARASHKALVHADIPHVRHFA